MHTQLSNNMKRPFLVGQVIIRSEESIESLAEKLSEALLSNVSFGGKEENVCEEIPAMFAEVAGFRFVLAGYPDEHYTLECFPCPGLPPFGDSVANIDISDHILRSIGNIENTTIELG